MKKVLISLAFIAISMLVTNVPKANAEEQVFGFLDNKFYNTDQKLVYFCFSDGNCYNMENQFVKHINSAVTTTPTITVNPIAQPSTPVASTSTATTAQVQEEIAFNIGDATGIIDEVPFVEVYKLPAGTEVWLEMEGTRYNLDGNNKVFFPNLSRSNPAKNYYYIIHAILGSQSKEKFGAFAF
jgi:hypothetical protein